MLDGRASRAGAELGAHRGGQVGVDQRVGHVGDGDGGKAGQRSGWRVISMPSVNEKLVSVAPAWVYPQPLPERERRLLIWEIIVVFAVSLGASAVRSLVSLIGSLTRRRP